MPVSLPHALSQPCCLVSGTFGALSVPHLQGPRPSCSLQEPEDRSPRTASAEASGCRLLGRLTFPDHSLKFSPGAPPGLQLDSCTPCPCTARSRLPPSPWCAQAQGILCLRPLVPTLCLTPLSAASAPLAFAREHSQVTGIGRGHRGGWRYSAHYRQTPVSPGLSPGDPAPHVTEWQPRLCLASLSSPPSAPVTASPLLRHHRLGSSLQPNRTADPGLCS